MNFWQSLCAIACLTGTTWQRQMRFHLIERDFDGNASALNGAASRVAQSSLQHGTLPD